MYRIRLDNRYYFNSYLVSLTSESPMGNSFISLLIFSDLCYFVSIHRILSHKRQVAHRLLSKTNELCLSSLLNFRSELWVNPRVPRKPFQPRGSLEISCPREKYNIRKGQKPRKPLKIQGSSLVVPIISLSPDPAAEGFNVCRFLICHILLLVCVDHWSSSATSSIYVSSIPLEAASASG